MTLYYFEEKVHTLKQTPCRWKRQQWNPDFTNLQGKGKLVRKIGEFEKSGVKLQCLTEEGKQLLVRIMGRLKKLRVREIGILL